MKLLIITGPTGSGKTSLSIKCAKYFDGEIISCDSMQIYRNMNIGTAKITKEEMNGITHHLIDIVDPNTVFNTYDYRQLALAAIKDIESRGKQPIIVGGTGLYIDSILYEMTFLNRNDGIREQLTNMLEEKGNTYMHELLKEYDIAAYEKLHENDTRRVIRALEVAMVGDGKKDNLTNPIFPYTMYYFVGDREILYERINNRVDLMMQQGLVDEVKQLISNGLPRNVTAMQAIGYKEIVEYLDGLINYEEAVELIKKRSRHYAKRQLCWFKKYPSIPLNFEHPDDAFEQIKNTFQK